MVPSPTPEHQQHQQQQHHQHQQHTPLQQQQQHQQQHHQQGTNASSTGYGEQSFTQYPDVASYQQPYFYGHTDPATYTSPWPPSQSHSYGNSIEYAAPQQHQSPMPYLPSNAGQRSTEDYGSGNVVAYSSGLPDLETSQHGYGQGVEPRQQQQHQHQPTVSSQYGSSYLEDASMHLKLQGLPMLDNLATQLIQKIAQSNLSQIQDLVRGSDAEESQAYRTLKALFDQTRRVYSRGTPFIDAMAIQMYQINQQEVIRKANIATFISSILGVHDVSFFHLNEFFLETFVPLGHRLLKWQGAVLLELKTQTYISALMNSDGSPEVMLDELFPADLDAQILTRHPDAPSLSPSEQDFIDRCKARKSYLLAEPPTESALGDLPKKYQWQDFIKEFASCICKNIDSIMSAPSRNQPLMGAFQDRRNMATPQSMQEGASLTSRGSQQRQPQAQHQPTPVKLEVTTPTQGQRTSSGQQQSSETRKVGGTTSATTRQPWTKPEEEALIAGLERVNGPHWSQILALYGRGGSISEVLKDRNQVQLKDKARNLKLWYLKMGKEVPVSLRGVTGELRKRGGARARAALERSEDDREASGSAAGGSPEEESSSKKGVRKVG